MAASFTAERQKGIPTTNGSGVFTFSPATNTTQGSTLILVVVGGAVTAISDTKGNPWNIDHSNVVAAGRHFSVCSCEIRSQLTTSDVITVTTDVNSTAVAYWCEEFGGGYYTYKDQTSDGTNANSTTLPAGTTGTTGSADELAIVAYVASASGAITKNASYTNFTTGNQTFGTKVGHCAYRVLSATGTQTADGTDANMVASNNGITTYYLRTDKSSSDTGSGADSQVVIKTSDDTSSGSDSQTETVTISDPGFYEPLGYGVYTYGDPFGLSSDTGTGDVGTAFEQATQSIGGGDQSKNDSDTGTDSEATTLAVAISQSDTGSGSDSATLTAAYANADTGSDSEASTLTAVISNAETGSDSENTTLTVVISGSDTGSDSETGVISIAATDSGSDSENQTLVVAISSADTGTSSENTQIYITSADTGAGSDNYSLTAAYSSSDTATDSENGTISFIATDAGSGSDAQTLAVAISQAETGSGSDNYTITTVSTNADTGSGSESSIISASISQSEAGSGSDTGTPTVSPLLSDTGSGTEDQTLVVVISSSDAGTDSEATVTALYGSDTGAGADNATLAVVIIEDDASSSTTDSGTTGTPIFGGDTGSGVEGISDRVFSADDTGNGTDAYSFTFAGEDSGVGSESVDTSATVSDSDSAIDSEDYVISAILTDSDTATSSENGSLDSGQFITENETGSGSESAALSAVSSDGDVNTPSDDSESLSVAYSASESALGTDDYTNTSTIAGAEVVFATADGISLIATISNDQSGTGDELQGLGFLVTDFGTADSEDADVFDNPISFLTENDFGTGLDYGVGVKSARWNYNESENELSGTGFETPVLVRAGKISKPRLTSTGLNRR